MRGKGEGGAMDLHSPRSCCWGINFSTASHALLLSKCVTCVRSCKMYVYSVFQNVILLQGSKRE